MVPDEIADRIAGAETPLDAAVELAIEQTRALRDVADGVHIMPLGADHTVPRILEGAGLA